MRFSVGDKVRVTSDKYNWDVVGKTGVINADDKSGLPYRVYFDDGVTPDEWYRASELELIDTDTPAVYRCEIPPEPEGVTRVRPVGGTTVWTRKGQMWEDPTGFTDRWYDLLRKYPNGVEVVPDSRSAVEREYDESLDYLRRNEHMLDMLAADGVTGCHAAAVVRGVLASEEENP